MVISIILEGNSIKNVAGKLQNRRLKSTEKTVYPTLSLRDSLCPSPTTIIPPIADMSTIKHYCTFKSGVSHRSTHINHIIRISMKERGDDNHLMTISKKTTKTC